MPSAATVSPEVIMEDEEVKLNHEDSLKENTTTPSPAKTASPSPPPPPPSFPMLVLAIVSYSACSASLLLINKFAVFHLPVVSFVLFCQFVASILVVKVCGAMGFLVVDALEWVKVKKFWGVSFLFACCLFTNVKALQYANVETLIVFRSLTPLFVAVMDFFFMGMELPNMRSWLSLISVVAGAAAYVALDGDFRLDSYLWVIAYVISIVSEMVYVKFVLTEVNMTTWGRVYYNNLLSIPPILLFGLVFGDYAILAKHEWSMESIIFLVASCVVGVAISYTGFHLRAMVTATSFTMIGVVNKLATTAINVLVWENHAEVGGLIALVFCVLGGTFYQQAEKKKG